VCHSPRPQILHQYAIAAHGLSFSVDGFTLLDLDALRDGDLVQATPRQPQPPQPQPLGLDEASIGRLTVASRHIAAAA
jgi:hypothetical protein